MQRIGYYSFLILYFFIRIMPFWLMYLISDLMFVVVYHITGYRRKVVSANLNKVFANESEEWRKAVEKKFFRHLCDIMIEAFKVRHMSIKTYRKRCTYTNLHYLEQAFNKGKDVILMGGHMNNWEYLAGISSVTDYQCLTLYMPMKNKYFDRFFIRTRSHFGLNPIPMKRIYQELVRYRKEGIRVLTGFGADQIPSTVKGKDWYNFLGVPTVVYAGAERIAKKNNDAVFYSKMVKVKRGYYNVEIIPMFDNAGATEDNEITRKYFQLLEEHILEEPAHWLWSHRRWKRKMPDGTEVLPLKN